MIISSSVIYIGVWLLSLSATGQHILIDHRLQMCNHWFWNPVSNDKTGIVFFLQDSTIRSRFCHPIYMFGYFGNIVAIILEVDDGYNSNLHLIPIKYLWNSIPKTLPLLNKLYIHVYIIYFAPGLWWLECILRSQRDSACDAYCVPRRMVVWMRIALPGDCCWNAYCVLGGEVVGMHIEFPEGWSIPKLFPLLNFHKQLTKIVLILWNKVCDVFAAYDLFH